MIRHLILCTLLFAGFCALSAEDKPVVVKPAEAKPAAAAETPKVERLTPDQWCTKHDVPKSVDGACDRKLIPTLKKTKDWCAEHDTAESVCVKCDPSAKERLDALRPAEKAPAAK